MIRIMLGNPGSGKTVCMVRELFFNSSRRMTFSNIITQDIDNNITINQDMLIKKNILKTKKSGEVVYDLKLNVDFWKKAVEKHQAINICIDEAHTVLNPRKSMSKKNVLMTDFLSLVRRILGSNDGGYGELIFITQLDNRIDTIAREMCTSVRYHRMHYKKSCESCGATWRETNETAEPRLFCPRCFNYKLRKHSHIVEVWHFKSMRHYIYWQYNKVESYHRNYFVKDIERFFPMYNTLQWESLVSDY